VKGSTYKRCPHGANCPDLSKRHHGSYFWQRRIDTSKGRVPVKRGGFRREQDAAAMLDRISELLSLATNDAAGKVIQRAIGDMIVEATLRGGQPPDRATVAARLGLGQDPGSSGVMTGEWLDLWLASRRRLRPSTRRSYEMHVRVWLKPHLGEIPLERLNAGHISRLLDTIGALNAGVAAQKESGKTPVRAAGDARSGIPRIVSASTQARIFATLRAALNSALKQRRIAYNPCVGVELEAPEPLQRQRWTPAQARRFLTVAADDPLGLMFRIAVLRGARRGELCGFRWSGADLERGILLVEKTALQLGGKLVEGKPKTTAGERKVFLDSVTAAMLREHRKAQVKARMIAGAAWVDNDLIFCQADGTPWHPDYVSRRFKKLAAKAGVPVIALHEGGRHTGNSLMRDAGVDQELRMREVGHSDRSVNDRYTHILEEAHLAAAERVATFVEEAAVTP
jgi:integrase